jgi:Asp-tRNA(Asn)/Glu-tRNA(Gln) amidotransferase A subunit family amidase
LQHFDRLRPQTQKLMQAAEFDYAGAERHRTRLEAFDVEAAFGAADVLLMPASAGEAPDLSTTGDPTFNRLASLLGLPAITVPVRLGPGGLPLGVQLIARRQHDEALLIAARAVERRFPFSAKIP